MTEFSLAVVIVVLGVMAIIAITVYAFMHAHNAQRDANRVVELALGGRADEARIIARNASAEVSALFDAIGGTLGAPKRSSAVRDFAMMLVTALPTVVFAGVCIAQIHTGAEAVLEGANSLLFGLAILIPVTFASAYTILSIGRHSARILRGSHVTLLARNVKNTYDTEVAESLRRGPGLKDPRGE